MKRRAAVVLPLLLAAAPYAHCLYRFDLVWEDPGYTIKHEAVHSLRNIPRFFTLEYWNRELTTPTRSYRPMREIAFAADYALWGPRPAGYRLTSILLHMAASACVYALALRWLDAAPALLAACAFAAHPTRVETVVYVKNKAEILAAVFALLAALAQLRAWERRRGGVAALGWLVLAVLSKATAVAAPAALACAAFARRLRAAAWIRLAPMALAAALCVYANARWIEKPRQPPGDLGRLGLRWRPALAAETWRAYLAMAFLPVHLHADRALAPPRRPWPAGAAELAAWALAGAWFACAARRRWPAVVFGAGWFAAFLAPALNLVLLEGRPIAEQRLYLPLAGLALAAAAGLRTRARRGLWLAAVLVFCALAGQRVFAWRDSRTLWFDNVRHAPEKTKSRNNLGRAYGRAGRYALAEAQFRKALQVNPRFGDAMYNMAAVCQSRGELAQANVWYSRLLTLDPSREDAWLQAGGVFWRLKMYDLAEKAFRSVLKRNPRQVMAWRNLAGVLRAQGRNEDAEAALRRAAALAPRDAETWALLGEMLDVEGRPKEAEKCYREALRLDDPRRDVYVNMGKLLYTRGRYPLARDAWAKLAARNPRDAEALAGLGLTAAALRDWAEFERCVAALRRVRPRLAAQLEREGRRKR